MTDTAPASAPLDVLAIGAHPDDAELFAGGTLSAMASAGVNVGIAALTQGELGSRGDVTTRRREMQDSTRILGVASYMLDLPDGGLHDCPEQRLKVAALLRLTRPRLVMTHAPRDRHPDHDAAHALVRAAVFMANLANAPIEGERHRIDRLVFFLGNHEPAPPAPSIVVAISPADFSRKLLALQAYTTQFAGKLPPAPPSEAAGQPHIATMLPPTFISSPEYWQWIEMRARYYGRLTGSTLGEPFLLDGPTPISALHLLAI